MKRYMWLALLCIAGASEATAFTIDGMLEAGYGTALAVQDTPTGFGDNQSELNAAYAVLDLSGNLSLLLTGNLEGNGNGLVIFIDSRAGGAIASTIDGGFGVLGSIGGARSDDWGTDTDGDFGVDPTPGGGSILDPGFNPDVAVEISIFEGLQHTNIIDLTLPNEPNGNRDVYLGSNLPGPSPVTQTYLRPDEDITKGHNGTIEHAIDNSNAAGVFGFDFDSPPGDLGDPLSATTGYEVLFSAAFLANDGQSIRIMAFITSGGGVVLSNQFLGEAGLAGATNLGGAGGPGGVPLFDAQLFDGNQFFTVPEPGDELDGDYNGNGKVDAADYVIWRNNNGTQQEYEIWRANFGRMQMGSGSGFGGAPTPEPASSGLILFGLLAGAALVRRQT